MMKWLLSLAITAALSGAALASPGQYPAPYTCTRNFYVATGGTNNGSCSQATPCDSMQTANNNLSLQGGDCVNFAAGVYNTGYQINLQGRKCEPSQWLRSLYRCS
jgi:hypothetical protein